MAENVAESLGKGSRVVVTGRLEQRSWETENGEKRSVVEIVADEVGPSLRWATAAGHPQRAPRWRRLRRRRWRRRWRRRRRRRRLGWRRRRRARREQLRRLRRGALLMARDRRSNSKSAAADRRRPQKKKISILNTEQVDWIDYKDVNLLRRFMSERAKIRARRVTGNSTQQQRAGGEGDPRRPRDGAAARTACVRSPSARVAARDRGDRGELRDEDAGRDRRASRSESDDVEVDVEAAGWRRRHRGRRGRRGRDGRRGRAGRDVEGAEA